MVTFYTKKTSDFDIWDPASWLLEKRELKDSACVRVPILVTKEKK
jgi:hypothetical protein